MRLTKKEIWKTEEPARRWSERAQAREARKRQDMIMNFVLAAVVVVLWCLAKII